jgi:hypothetical protein
MDADRLGAAWPEPKKRGEGTTDFSDATDKQLAFVSSVPSVKSVVKPLVSVFSIGLAASEGFEAIARQMDNEFNPRSSAFIRGSKLLFFNGLGQ